MIAGDFFYAFPIAAYAFFLLPIFALLFWYSWERRTRQLKSLTPNPQIASSIALPNWKRIAWRSMCFLLGTIALILALMQPKGNGHYPANELGDSANSSDTEGRVPAHEVIFFIDTSASMTVLDAPSGQSRLSYAQEIADQVASRLSGETGSIWTFTSSPFQVVPSTVDYFFLRLMLRSLQINEGEAAGTDFAKALNLVKQQALSAYLNENKTLIILSDGGDNRYELAKEGEKSRDLEQLLSSLDQAQAQHLKVYTIGVGSSTGGKIPNLTYQGQSVESKLNETLLKAVSAKGNGQYYAANSYSSSDLADDLITKMRQRPPIAFLNVDASLNHKQLLIYDDFFQMPLTFALLFFLGAFYTPEAAKKMGAIASVSLFFSGAVLWANVENAQLQRANTYAEAQSFKVAKQLYEELSSQTQDPYEKAVLAYDQGTLLLQEEAFERGIPYFSQALRAPSNALLRYRAYANLALSQLKSAEKTGHLAALLDSLYSFFEAQKAHCELLEEMGAQMCEQLSSASFIPQAQQLFNQLAEQQKEQLSLSQTFSSLLAGFYRLQADLTQLSSVHDQALKKVYQQDIAKREKDWKAFLTQFQMKLKLDSIEFKDFSKVLTEKNSQEALALMEEWRPSLKAMARLVVQKENPSTFLEGFTFNLSYRPFIEQVSVEQIKAWVNLWQTGKSLYGNDVNRPYFKRFEIFLKQTLKDSEAWQYESAAKAFKQGQFVLHQIKVLQQPDVPFVQQIIELVILAQQQVIDWNEQGLTDLAQPVQAQILKLCDLFFVEVLKLQQIRFNEASSQSRCQSSPWEIVLPTFEKGAIAARQASVFWDQLQNRERIGLQNTAISAWEKALNSLKQPSPSKSCHGQTNSFAPSAGASINTTLQQLQEMEQSDTPSAVPSGQIQEGLLPW